MEQHPLRYIKVEHPEANPAQIHETSTDEDNQEDYKTDEEDTFPQLDKDILLKDLNKMQRKAARYVKKPLLILAGVGTGKTETLMRKYAYLIGHLRYDPSNILSVTFTNKAAKEMKHRAAKILNCPYKRLKEGWISTFHSLSLRILKEHSNYKLVGLKDEFHILDPPDQKKLLKELLKEDIATSRLLMDIVLKMKREKGDTSMVKQVPYGKICKSIDKFKNFCIFPEDPNFEKMKFKDFDTAVFRTVYKPYQELLLQRNSVDYGDLIQHSIDLFLRHPLILHQYQEQFKYILVDEVQDLNKNQQKWLTTLVGDKPEKLSCVGDDDQMIYGFRGATGEFILNFDKIYPNAKIIKLEQNYRSTKQILLATNNLISHNKKRHGKSLWTDNEEGKAVKIQQYYDDAEEIAKICDYVKSLNEGTERARLSDIAILTRTNKDAQLFEPVLIQQNIPYELHPNAHKFLDRKEVKIAFSYLLLLGRSNDSIAFQNVLSSLDGFGETTVLNLVECHKKSGLSLREVCEMVLQGKPIPCKASTSPKLEMAEIKIEQQQPKGGAGEEKKKSQQNSLTSFIKKRGAESLLEGIEQETKSFVLDKVYRKATPSEQILVKQEAVKTETKLVKLQQKQKDNLQKLMQKIKQYKNAKNEEELIIYATNVGLYDFVKNKCPKDKDCMILIQNVESLIRLAASFESMNDFYDQVALFAGETSSDNFPVKDSIKILTIHSSKGLEWKYVFLPGWIKGKLPMGGFSGETAAQQDTLEEERRIAFVGITRAKKFVHISHYRQRVANSFSFQGTGIVPQPSEFIQQISMAAKKPEK
ncbi:hypothetical protein FGO68_gene12902 [Halteria grandinella]|uniref:DNA 3'-5' helicase n=1 Tax=Halteria grandinella TaxID=5974 RepID=A0A8J8NZU6_HALGN|nr:hypothetical protein FGO68_gene12902 [Halteria grandinella]